MKLISIIIPAYNREHLLGETLNSIKNQTYLNWECIIVDDGSKDNTIKVIESFCEKDNRFKFFSRPLDRPKGANACRNFGFEISKGDYINWFDSDDIMHPRKLELQIEKLEETGKVLCVCQTQVFENNIENNLGLRHPKLVSDNFWEDYIMFKILWLTQAPLWKKSFLQKMNYLFDEELQAAQEWEFHVRALSQIKDYDVIKESLVYLRIHSKSISTGYREKVLWHYFSARLKIYKRFKNALSDNLENYFSRYFLNRYKTALRDHQMILAFKIWKSYILKTKNLRFRSKVLLTAAYPSFRFTKKGNRFLTHINE